MECFVFFGGFRGFVFFLWCVLAARNGCLFDLLDPLGCVAY